MGFLRGAAGRMREWGWPRGGHVRSKRADGWPRSDVPSRCPLSALLWAVDNMVVLAPMRPWRTSTDAGGPARMNAAGRDAASAPGDAPASALGGGDRGAPEAEARARVRRRVVVVTQRAPKQGVVNRRRAGARGRRANGAGACRRGIGAAVTRVARRRPPPRSCTAKTRRTPAAPPGPHGQDGRAVGAMCRVKWPPAAATSEARQ